MHFTSTATFSEQTVYYWATCTI